MAIVAIKFLGQYMNIRQEADEEIWQCVFVRVLRVINAQRTAFGAADRAGNSAFGHIPALEQGIGLLEFIRRNLKVGAVNSGAVMKFRGDSRVFESPLILFAVRSTAKECNGDFIHVPTSARTDEESMGCEPDRTAKGGGLFKSEQFNIQQQTSDWRRLTGA
jgi:hypothetical protein